MDGLKRLIDRGETIDEPIAIGESRMTQDIADADRMKRRRAAAVWRVTCQFKENLRQQKIASDQFENLCSLLWHARRKCSFMDRRGVVRDLAQSDERRSDLVLYPAAHLERGRPQLFKRKVKLIIGNTPLCWPFGSPLLRVANRPAH